jgi:hypothetical protein
MSGRKVLWLFRDERREGEGEEELVGSPPA